MIAFMVIVLNEFRNGAAEVPLPNRNLPIQTFFLDRSHEALGVGIGVRRRSGIDTTRMPASRSRRRTSRLHFRSRSQIKIDAHPRYRPPPSSVFGRLAA
jgi:hypothetical protein